VWRFITILICCAIMPCAFAAGRFALIVGNGNYQNVPYLPNPTNDAQLIARTLGGLGFDVALQFDGDRRSMERSLLEFAQRARGADVAFIFYAGHGIQLKGRNYLIPVDAQLEDDFALRLEALDLSLVLEATGGADFQMIVLDACRNNPFAARMRLSDPGRMVSRGLGRVEPAQGDTLIAFSTSPDDVAEDGVDGNSPFSSALARYLAEPGLEIRQVFTRVTAEVLGKTANRQRPWEQSSLTRDLFLAGAKNMQPGAQVNLSKPDEFGFMDLGGNVLFDVSTGLQWTQMDNGAFVDWHGADEYCRSLSLNGGGWRLPSTSNLVEIHGRERGKYGAQACNLDQDCATISRLFRLGSKDEFWSATTLGGILGAYVEVREGSAIHWRLDGKFRALCVRNN